jgi:hypothetical protein
MVKFMKTSEKIYLTLFIVGTLAPLWPLVDLAQQIPPSFGAFVAQTWVTPLSRSLTTDLLITCVILWYWIAQEWPTHRAPGRARWLWIIAACNLFVAISSAMPLYLYLRSRWKNTPSEP